MSSVVPISVLIVEDDPWFAEQHVRVLRAENYDVHVAPHALDAIDNIDKIKPQVIILDVLLPGATGFALLHELQSYQDTAKIPVILCTSTATSINLRDVQPYGVYRILDKATMTPEDVVAAVRSVTL